MRSGARPAAVLAAVAAISWLATASLPAAASQAASTTRAASGARTTRAIRTTRATRTTRAVRTIRPTRTAWAARTTRSTRAARVASALAARSASAPTTSRTAAADVGGSLMASQGVVVNYPASHAVRLPRIPASAWVIANADTGQVLAARDPHGEFGPASTMKVLTAITLIPLLNPNAMVQASKQAADTEPNDAGLVAGRWYKVSELFTALLTISANDAAVALTQATGSFAKGMALINAEAHHLQAYDVVAKQPNGLPAAGQVESAYDEALIARQALASPEFMRYDSTLAARFEVKPGDWETLVNQNWLLTKYPGALGGKIGWTISSEATYIGLARRHGVTLIVTIMHCTPLQEITSAEKLLNWGFAMNGAVNPVGVLVPPLRTVTVAGHASQAARARLASRAVQASGVHPADYALAVGVLAVAGFGLGRLAWNRRRPVPGRYRPLGQLSPSRHARGPGRLASPANPIGPVSPAVPASPDTPA
jgi:serine-type D-Ala-D-Ala carboxypeptidase (penicillin-binding protein 5/6)